MMNNILKMFLSLAAVLIIFRVGYQKSVDKNSGIHPKKVLNALAKTKKTAPGRKPLTPLPMMNILPGEARFTINGIPAEIDAYLSKASLEQEKSRFTTRWSAKGYKTYSKTFGKANILSAYDENKKLFNSVILIPGMGEQQTYVIPSTLDLSKPPESREFNSPIYPDSKTIFHIESNDLAGYSENVILLSNASVPSIMNYYKNQLIPQGWEIAPEPKTIHNPEYLDKTVFVKGSDERWVYSGKVDNSDQTVVFLLYNDKY